MIPANYNCLNNEFFSYFIYVILLINFNASLNWGEPSIYVIDSTVSGFNVKGLPYSLALVYLFNKIIDSFSVTE